MADLQGRLSPSCLEEFEDESLDPRIQVCFCCCFSVDIFDTRVALGRKLKR